MRRVKRQRKGEEVGREVREKMRGLIKD